jgi:hypothetical protein
VVKVSQYRVFDSVGIDNFVKINELEIVEIVSVPGSEPPVTVGDQIVGHCLVAFVQTKVFHPHLALDVCLGVLYSKVKEAHWQPSVLSVLDGGGRPDGEGIGDVSDPVFADGIGDVLNDGLLSRLFE